MSTDPYDPMQPKKPKKTTTSNKGGPKASAENYDVGYKKPPQKSQFKPGESGNPKGRPKGRPDAGELFLHEAMRLVKYEHQGYEKYAPRIELIYRQLLNLATKGDLRATALVLARFDRLMAKEETLLDLADTGAKTGGFDEDAVKRMFRRFSHLALEEPDD